MKYIFLFLFISNPCMSQTNVGNTKWVFDFEGCQDYFKFQGDNNYEFFSCESGDTVFGKYTLEGTTLILEQLKGSYDCEFDANSRHQTPQLKFKLSIEEEELKFLESWELDANGKWQNTGVEFPSTYSFRKEK